MRGEWLKISAGLIAIAALGLMPISIAAWIALAMMGY
jgi:hypothetical protein